MSRRLQRLALALGLLALALWGLRDPAWLQAYRHGLHPDGWTGGRASFYVPSADPVITFDLAGHEQFTTQVSISVDGRLVDRFSVDASWRTVRIPVADRPTSRRHRRVDVHVARAWGDPRKGVRIRPPAVRDRP
jgi:hypothetical protein